MINRIELLAPAGDIEIAKAAINAGADAVYIGGKWSARAYAKNFDTDEIRELVDYAHIRDRKVYVALNTMLFNSEMREALSYTRILENIRVDALISSDLGYIREIGKDFSIPVHASTQLSVASRDAVRLLKDLNVTRVVPARECSEEQIRELLKEGLEIEVFCHGALCSSISGACLMSGMISDRSGNRGTCAQICRQKFMLDGREGHYLNTKDLCLADRIGDLIDMGVSSLKIEGRMKSRNYVVNTVKAYRDIIDDAVYDMDKLKDELKITFNRGGFTEGYLNGKEGIDYPEDNTHKGLLVGKVLSCDGIRTVLTSSYPVGKNDSLEIGGTGLRTERTERRDEGIYEIHSKGTFRKGDRVFLKQSAELLKKNETVSRDSFKREVQLSFSAAQGGEAVLTARSGGVSACAAIPVSEVSRKDIDPGSIRANVEKTGGTVFIPKDTQIDIKGRPFLSLSMINGLRREVLSDLEDAILESFAYPEKKMPDGKTAEEATYKRYISVDTDDMSLLERLDPLKVKRAYIRPKSISDLEKIRKGTMVPAYLVLPPFLSLRSQRFIDDLLEGEDHCIKGIVAGNINGVGVAKGMVCRL